jgi:hypothetical protein
MLFIFDYKKGNFLLWVEIFVMEMHEIGHVNLHLQVL